MRITDKVLSLVHSIKLRSENIFNTDLAPKYTAYKKKGLTRANSDRVSGENSFKGKVSQEPTEKSVRKEWK